MTDLDLHVTSDADGVRHVVLARQDDEPGTWRVLVWGCDDDITSAPPRREAVFRRRSVWGAPGNLLGFGVERSAWVVVVDRDEVAEVEYAGGRHHLVVDEGGKA